MLSQILDQAPEDRLKSQETLLRRQPQRKPNSNCLATQLRFPRNPDKEKPPSDWGLPKAERAKARSQGLTGGTREN